MLKDSAISKILQFIERIDAAGQRNGDLSARLIDELEGVVQMVHRARLENILGNVDCLRLEQL